MKVRKNIYSLTKDEKDVFINAILELKKKGRYDEYIHMHHHLMHPSVHPDEPYDPVYRNPAHRGPAFLPWHRAFLLEFERDLQSIDKEITVPYWDWTSDAELYDPKTAAIWNEDFMGGDGDPNSNFEVATGPFAYNKGNWTLPMDGPALTRRFGSFPGISTLPKKEDLELALNEAFYDTPNYNSSPFCIGFRNRIEGWITKRGDAQVKTAGSQLHNRVHLWVGGMWEVVSDIGTRQIKNGQQVYATGAMVKMSSPNDPVFFLHHCFVDKVWADWQNKKKMEFDETGFPEPPHYAPITNGPEGHNLKDIMKPFNISIEEVLNTAKLGYQYEEIKGQSQLIKIPISPFFAD